MINFALGAFFSSAILITLYFIIFREKKIIDYRRKEQLERLLSQKDFEFLLIDIRQEEEFQKGHLPFAANIPFNKLITSLPVENMFLTIIVYGGNKKISSLAANHLSEKGYFNVTSFGSFSRWKGKLINDENIGDTHIENTISRRANFTV